MNGKTPRELFIESLLGLRGLAEYDQARNLKSVSPLNQRLERETKMSVSAKFHCNVVRDCFTNGWTKDGNGNWKETGEKEKTGEEIEMSPVYATEGPNKTWSEATPSGNVRLFISNKGAWGKFKSGKEYLINFSEAE